MSRKSSRVPQKRVISPEGAAQTVLNDGYADFNATEGSESDGKEDCKVTMWYRVTGSGNPLSPVQGSTGKNQGHAEMDALNTLLGMCDSNGVAFNTLDVYMQCEDKPCCGRCAAILGYLSVEPLNSRTKKTKASMGSTEWAVGMRIAEYLASLGVNKTAIKYLGMFTPE